ncbi:MAG: hypothetical protein Q9219_007181 [cf. Caloplaca sp. 3 TL-2023]
MYFYRLSLLSLVWTSSASPTSPPLGTRSPIDTANLSNAENFTGPQEDLCRGDMSTVYNSSCYDVLRIPQFLQIWQGRVTQCSNGTPGCTGCTPGEAWSTCFLRLALGKASHDCTKINVKSCELEDFDLLNPASINAPEIRYIVRNIYAINSLFTNWCELVVSPSRHLQREPVFYAVAHCDMILFFT